MVMSMSIHEKMYMCMCVYITLKEIDMNRYDMKGI